MAKKEIKELTPRDENYSQWYQDIVTWCEFFDLFLSHDASLSKLFASKGTAFR